MAGISLGVTSPEFPVSNKSVSATAVRVPAVSRKRRCHAVFSLNGELTIVYSLRRVAPGMGVQIAVGHEGPVLAPHMSPLQARGLARALISAADAVDEQRAGRV